ncbi:hypothetical protein [Nocardia sp. NPDC004860]|uniref:hypothetical protein n=1 Tax=Nocardia sp. NPDC004860 TaxID=3154557 RepID=UPI0033A02300
MHIGSEPSGIPKLDRPFTTVERSPVIYPRQAGAPARLAASHELDRTATDLPRGASTSCSKERITRRSHRDHGYAASGIGDRGRQRWAPPNPHSRGSLVTSPRETFIAPYFTTDGRADLTVGDTAITAVANELGVPVTVTAADFYRAT